MNSDFPVTHSILSVPALLAKITADYAIDPPIDGHLLQLGLNDTFRICTRSSRYITRVYRHGWRNRAAILYELAALQHLQARGVKVAAPIARRDGEWISPVTAPEGVRYLVLFANAEGEEPWFDGETGAAASDRRSDADLYGRSVARMHRASADFHSNHDRFELNLDYLLAQSLAKIQPFLSDHSADWAYFVDLTQRVRQQIETLSNDSINPAHQLEIGFCHGDFQGGNAHIQPTDRSLTFFDFDCCGQGWRAYDLAVFRWQVAVNGLPLWVWDAFLAGYREERAIAVIDLAAIPFFVAVRQVWIMGLHCGNSGDWGVGWLNGQYFARSLNFLRTWETNEFPS